MFLIGLRFRGRKKEGKIEKKGLSIKKNSF